MNGRSQSVPIMAGRTEDTEMADHAYVPLPLRIVSGKITDEERLYTATDVVLTETLSALGGFSSQRNYQLTARRAAWSLMRHAGTKDPALVGKITESWLRDDEGWERYTAALLWRIWSGSGITSMAESDYLAALQLQLALLAKEPWPVSHWLQALPNCEVWQKAYPYTEPRGFRGSKKDWLNPLHHDWAIYSHHARDVVEAAAEEELTEEVSQKLLVEAVDKLVTEHLDHRLAKQHFGVLSSSTAADKPTDTDQTGGGQAQSSADANAADAAQEVPLKPTGLAALSGDLVAEVVNFVKAGKPAAQVPDALKKLSYGDAAAMELLVLEAFPWLTEAPEGAAAGTGGGPGPSTAAPGQVKVPGAPFFKGEKGLTPRSVHNWLNIIKLHWAQLKPPDPVLYALNFLRDDASSWVNVTLKRKFGDGLTGIDPKAFEEALFEEYLPLTVALEADGAFRRCKQTGSVEAFRKEFLMSRDELSMLKGVSVPDATEQTRIFYAGLKPHVQSALKGRLTQQHVTDLDALMKAAVEAETVRTSLSWYGSHFSHADGPADHDKGKGRGSADKGHVKESARSDKPPQHKRDVSSDKAAAQKRARDDGAGKQRPAPNEFGVRTPDGKLWPNAAWQALPANQKHALDKHLCYRCHNRHDIAAGTAREEWHKTPACPAKVSTAAPVQMTDASPAKKLKHDAAVCAAINADASDGLCMTLMGTAGRARKGCVILLDPGSTCNFLDKEFAGEATLTGKHKEVQFADGRLRKHVPEAIVSVSLHGYTADLVVLLMQLPDGIDAILGIGWCKQNDAIIRTKEGSCSFVDALSGQAYCVTVSRDIAGSKDTVNCNMVSASCCTSALEQAYLVFVKPVEAETGIERAAAVQMHAHAHGQQASDADELLDVGHASIAEAVRSLVHEYADLFPTDVPDGLPPERPVAHAIPLEHGSIPSAQKARRYSSKEADEIERQIAELLKKGWIRPSSSPFGSPVLLVRKKDGSMRMCVDYRALNKQTIRNSYPLPRIDDMLDKLAGACCFTSLDMQQAYHQVRLADGDVPKTAFVTPMGLYEYRVLSFGLTNAPVTFQALMNSILGPELRDHCVVYMDDIMVFSKTPEGHVLHLRRVLEQLRKHQLYAKLRKCRFAQKPVHFLGHVISAEGVLPDDSKVEVLLHWPIPNSVKEVQQFVGLAQYFRKFIMGFASMAAPLTALFRKNAAWAWSPVCQQAFEQIKQALVQPPVLKLPEDDVQFTVVCDASGVGIGAVLLQEGRPIAFDGRKLTPVEAKWDTTEQEMLAVVYHLQKWRCYLDGKDFVVVTDHQPNTWFNSQKQLNPRQYRWYEQLRSLTLSGSTSLVGSMWLILSAGVQHLLRTSVLQ